MALTIKYLIASFAEILPWATCLPEWGENCISMTSYNSTVSDNATQVKLISSAELYFTWVKLVLLEYTETKLIFLFSNSKIVLHEKENIEHGIGTPSWDLAIYLFIVWVIIVITLIKGKL